MAIKIIKHPIPRSEIETMAKTLFGDLVKAVVDIERGTMAVDMELHADGETLMLESGSQQKNLWGINLYPGRGERDFIEFDSMINIRPQQGNRSRSVEDPNIQKQIITIVKKLII